MMQKFWNWLQRNFNTRGTVTVMVVGTICYMSATGVTVPNELWSISTFILGFYFGAKVMVGATRARGG